MQNILSDSRTKAANYPATVSGFLRVAFTQLAETAPEAAQLLELFAWLGADPVSLGLLRRGRRGAVTSPLRETLQEPSRLSKAVHDLRRYGLAIVINDDPLRVQVHRVFQRVLRDWLADKRLARGRANVQAILAAANPGEPDDARSWGHYAEVGPHIQVAGLTTAVDFEIRLAALDQMRYLFRIGHYLESIELGQSLIASTELVEQNELSDARHHFYVSARHRLANAMRMVGRYSEAKELTLEALDYLERHPDFGSQDEYLAGLDMNRAADLRIAGNYANALTVDEVALDGQLRRDLDDQDKIRTIRNNIAVNLRLLGRFSEAHEIDREIVAQWTNARGAYDPRTLFARCNLARDLYGLGRYAEALNEVRACLPVYRDVVGANHHGVLLAVRTEVMALRKLGELASAFRLAEQNHRDLTTWFDPKHEYTLAAGISLLNVRLAMDDLGIAATQGTLLLGECADLFGPEHPMTLAVMVNAASASRALDDVHSALASDRRAVESLGRVLGAGHPYTLCAHHNMSVDLALLGRHDEALAAATTVLTRSAATRGDSHPDTLACAVNVGQAGGAPSDQTLRAFEDALGRSHPLVVAARDGTWIACDIEPPPA
jgi:tetratricopeptide (TPR) repeat protein